ncbi:MAG: GreA/GreB family elongation factor, partial [Ignavibacteriales bacterium]
RNMVSGEENVYTLVFPFDADLSQNRLSILAPEGVAIIGCKTGEEIELDQPAEMAKIKIEEILYQPEAQGNYYI